MHKTLSIISQRAQAVDVTARGNVTFFYKCEKKQFPFMPAYFKVYRTEEIDENSSYPLWARHNSNGEITWKAPVYHKGFAKKWIYNAYDSWYMRQQMIRSQDIKVEAYEVSFMQKVRLLFKKKPKQIYKPVIEPVLDKEPETQSIMTPALVPSPMVEYISREVHLSSQGIKLPLYRAKKGV